MSDQEDRLREAIERWRKEGALDQKQVDLVLTAAASTLLNTKRIWQLIGWPGDTSLSRSLSAGYDQRADAEAEALKWLRAGGSVTSLRQISVPA